MSDVPVWARQEDGGVPSWAAPPLTTGTATSVTPTAPPVLPGYARWPLGLASAGASGIAYGLGLPGDIERLGVQYVTNPLARLTGIGQVEPTDQEHLFFPTSETMLDVARSAGLTGYPSLTPQSAPERIAQAGASGLGSAIPMILAGAPALPTAIMGASGGAAGQGAAELGAPPAGQIAAGMLGGLAAGGATQAVIHAMSRKLPQIAADLGDSATLQAAGNELQLAARDWKANVMPQKEAAAWAPVDAAVPANGQVTLSNFSSALQDINRKAGQLQPLANLLSSALPRQLSSVMQQTGQIADWSDARTVRTLLGDAMHNPKLVADIGDQNLKHLYAGITSDLSDTANSFGAGQEFAAANAESTRLHAIAEGPMSRIVSGVRPSVADDPRPEDVAQRLLSGGRRGATDLQILRGEIPDAVDELAAAHLRLNPDAKTWSKLAPEAQEALVESPSDRDILDRTAAGTIAGQKSPLARIGEHTLGLWLGGAAGAAVSPFLPVAINPYVAAGVGELAGAAAPFIWHGMRSALSNPMMLAPGAVGGAAQQSLGVMK